MTWFKAQEPPTIGLTVNNWNSDLSLITISAGKVVNVAIDFEKKPTQLCASKDGFHKFTLLLSSHLKCVLFIFLWGEISSFLENQTFSDSKPTENSNYLMIFSAKTRQVRCVLGEFQQTPDALIKIMKNVSARRTVTHCAKSWETVMLEFFLRLLQLLEVNKPLDTCNSKRMCLVRSTADRISCTGVWTSELLWLSEYFLKLKLQSFFLFSRWFNMHGRLACTYGGTFLNLFGKKKVDETFLADSGVTLCRMHLVRSSQPSDEGETYETRWNQRPSRWQRRDYSEKTGHFRERNEASAGVLQRARETQRNRCQ